MRHSSQTPEPAFRSPKVQALSVKWRQVWLMTMDRRRRLQDALDQQKEVHFMLDLKKKVGKSLNDLKSWLFVNWQFNWHGMAGDTCLRIDSF